MLWIGAEMLNILGVYSVFIALAYFAMFLHEIGHILAALYFKIEVKKVGYPKTPKPQYNISLKWIDKNQ